jgi:hypothetical protein
MTTWGDFATWHLIYVTTQQFWACHKVTPVHGILIFFVFCTLSSAIADVIHSVSRISLRIIIVLSSVYRIDRRSAAALDLYLGDSRFQSPLWQRLFWPRFVVIVVDVGQFLPDMLYSLATNSVECELGTASVKCHLKIEVKIYEYMKPFLTYTTVTLVNKSCEHKRKLAV